MASLFIHGGEIIGEFSIYPNPGLLVKEGKLGFHRGGPPGGVETFDAGGMYIAAGLIDLHVHGGAGADALDDDPAALEEITSFHARYGTTGLLLTIAAAPLDKMITTVRAVAEAKSKIKGARILGVHLEGPYLNPSFKGAQNEEFLRRPDLSELRELIEAGAGLIRMVTLAPELPGGLEAVANLASRGVIPSLGHSGATFEEAREAFRRGLRHVTHFFNAMSPLRHREPGPAGLALTEPDISLEVIADGLHVHSTVLKILWQLKGDSLVLVTDAVAASGMPDGEYPFAGQTVAVKNGRVTLPGGKLAGSSLTMAGAVRNMARLAELEIPQALRLASLNPARILGMPDNGRVAEGCDADIVLFSRELEPRLVLVGGERFSAESLPSL